MEQSELITATFTVKDIISLTAIIVSATVSIVLFRLGIKHQVKSQTKKERDKYNQLEVYLKESVFFLIENINQQIKYIEESIESLKDPSSEKLSVNIVPGIGAADLLKMKDEDLRAIFILRKDGTAKRKSMDLNNFKNYLRHLEIIKETLKKHNLDIVNISKENLTEWNLHWFHFQNLHNEYVLQMSKIHPIKISPPNKDLLDFLHKTVIDGNDLLKNKSIEILNEFTTKFIRPILEHISTKKYINIEFAQKMIAVLNRCMNSSFQ